MRGRGAGGKGKGGKQVQRKGGKGKGKGGKGKGGEKTEKKTKEQLDAELGGYTTGDKGNAVMVE